MGAMFRTKSRMTRGGDLVVKTWYEDKHGASFTVTQMTTKQLKSCLTTMVNAMGPELMLWEMAAALNPRDKLWVNPLKVDLIHSPQHRRWVFIVRVRREIARREKLCQMSSTTTKTTPTSGSMKAESLSL